MIDWFILYYRCIYSQINYFIFLYDSRIITRVYVVGTGDARRWDEVGEEAVGHRYESVKSGSAESTSENLVPQSADSDYWFIKSLTFPFSRPNLLSAVGAVKFLTLPASNIRVVFFRHVSLITIRHVAELRCRRCERGLGKEGHLCSVFVFANKSIADRCWWVLLL